MKTVFIYSLFVILVFASCNSKEKQNYTTISTNSQPKTELEKSIDRGKTVYTDFCVQCHLANGKGVPGAFPPLDGPDWLTDKREESIYAVKYGQSGEIVVNGIKYNNVMLPMGLSNKEIADVMNYVMNSWSNTQLQMVTEEEVERINE